MNRSRSLERSLTRSTANTFVAPKCLGLLAPALLVPGERVAVQQVGPAALNPRLQNQVRPELIRFSGGETAP